MFSLPIVALGLLSSFAAADFKIYAVDSAGADPSQGATFTWSGITFHPGPPSCDDVCNKAIFISVQDDVSAGSSGVRCDGCSGKPEDWNVNEFEFQNNDEGVHWTLYGGSGLQLTPADGGPLRGSCVKDNSDSYGPCSCGLGNAEWGTQIFSCTSDYTPETLGVYKS